MMEISGEAERIYDEFHIDDFDRKGNLEILAKALSAARADERERCAKICEALQAPCDAFPKEFRHAAMQAAANCARQIRGAKP